ncbi:MAG TPA: 3-phosphoshikimate 1-carboxyvinyltransferase [Dehalococcoidia bacterium]|nr:3-phosphoshikimate 1-carboxyvinyltransferase [Dehalococcoidia bacterium]
MPLPDVIEIVPPVRPAPVLVTIPGSKSITNRALILAALADGKTRLRGALWSEDTEIMVEALRTLGFELHVDPDPAEAGNCTIEVTGLGGHIPNAGSPDHPLEIYVGNAGTAARFLMAMLCLGNGVYRVHGTPRMHERPQAPLFDSLGQLGYRISVTNGGLPATLHGEGGSLKGSCTVSIEESSQFASALLLSSRVGGWHVTVTGHDAEESAYVAMTSKLMEVFPPHGGEYQIEPDCSSASYFLAAGALLQETRLAVAAWPESDWQIDGRFIEYLRRFKDGEGAAYPAVSRLTDLGDAIMTAIVLAPLLPRPSTFVDLGRLRVQESERVQALRQELTKCGARVVESGDTLEVFPSELHGAEIETYDDHRVAMCFATLGLKVPGMRIKDPGCVRKTFPNFYAKLAEPAPTGLGAIVLDARTRRRLSGDDLLAG